MRWTEAIGLTAAILGLASLSAAFVVAAAAPRPGSQTGGPADAAMILVQR